MKELLAIEWLKIKKYRTFWILIILFGALLFLWNYLISANIIKPGGDGGRNNLNVLSISYTFPAVWGNVAFWTKFFDGLLAIIIIILTTNEYQFRTNRQNVIDGLERKQFFNAKWLVVLVLSLVITLYAFLQGLLFGFANGSSFSTEHLEKIFYVLLLTINYFGFALTLSFLLKKTGMTVVIFLLYNYIIETILQQLLNWKIDAKPGNFLPMQCSAELLPFPLMESFKAMMHSSGPSTTTLAIVSVLWIIIYYVTGRNILMRSDW